LPTGKGRLDLSVFEHLLPYSVQVAPSDGRDQPGHVGDPAPILLPLNDLGAGLLQDL
jgi:hypothetical protein